jgi:hypothetical protein
VFDPHHRARPGPALTALLTVALLLPAPAVAQVHRLSVPEARHQVERFLEDIAAQSGDDMSARRIGRCVRGSATRVSCRFYEAGTDGMKGYRYSCGGHIRVVKRGGGYSSGGYGVTCSRR